MKKNLELYHLIKDWLRYKDGHLYWKVSKGCAKKGRRAGYKAKHYEVVKFFGKGYMVHRLIYLIHHGYLPQYLDHIDNDTFNNRIENLREATYSNNNCNVGLTKANTSGVKGVSWCKHHEKWRARVDLNKKTFYLGHHDDIKDAEKVVRKVREQLHKEFTNHGT